MDRPITTIKELWQALVDKKVVRDSRGNGIEMTSLGLVWSGPRLSVSAEGLMGADWHVEEPEPKPPEVEFWALELSSRNALPAYRCLSGGLFVWPTGIGSGNCLGFCDEPHEGEYAKLPYYRAGNGALAFYKFMVVRRD